MIKRQTGMSQLEPAKKHLAEALTRLEKALTQRLTQGGPGAPVDYERRLAALAAERNDLAGQVKMLREECDRLTTALNEVQRDHRNLRDVTGHVARRIDGSIAEIDRLLEG
jgi:predicted  nucleic acid-binding Zn-ribbon protein